VVFFLLSLVNIIKKTKLTKPISYNPKYPSIEELRKKAKKKIPKFAFEYLDGGCNEEGEFFSFQL